MEELCQIEGINKKRGLAYWKNSGTWSMDGADKI